MRLAVLCVVALTSCQRNDRKPERTAAPPAAADASSTKVAHAPPLPDPLPGKRSDLSAVIGSASRAAIGTFAGTRAIATADATQLRLIDGSGRVLAAAPVDAGINVLAAIDVDGDGTSEIVAGWGESREHRGVAARITLHRVQGAQLVAETIAEPDTTRAEIVAILPYAKDALFVAYYDSKFMVTSAVARRAGQGWQLDKSASIRMATSYARGDIDGDGTPELVVGRMYGDDKGIDGDAFVLAANGARTPLPTTRGLRSLAIAGGDIYFGDGWHQNYGQLAQGLLTHVHHGPDGFHAELIEDTPGQYAIEKIVPATIDGALALVAMGSHYVRVYRRVGDAWHGLTIAGAARDVAVGDLDGAPGDEILVVGDRSELVDLRGVAW